ncbi:MAG: prolyl aminopeptidase [Planktomarina sp.]
MNKDAGQKSTIGHLYPHIDPFDSQMIDVGDGHVLYVEQCGNPNGQPVVVLHGGPGGGCSPWMRRFFDPSHYRVILFDQRGCGRSRPYASVEANTTWHLLQDIEHIRRHLRIDRWMVFGGSWGATLALIYAQNHPEHVKHMILRGVFLGTQAELDWFYGGGVGQFWPEPWAKFANMIPKDEQTDFIEAYGKRLFSGDMRVELQYAQAWTAWENAMASMNSRGIGSPGPADFARAFARIENHYFRNGVFLDESTAILNNLDKLEGIPGTIVQGRYDMVCPPKASWTLAGGWKDANLRMVDRAGHALSEHGIIMQLMDVTDRLRNGS